MGPNLVAGLMVPHICIYLNVPVSGESWKNQIIVGGDSVFWARPPFLPNFPSLYPTQKGVKICRRKRWWCKADFLTLSNKNSASSTLLLLSSKLILMWGLSSLLCRQLAVEPELQRWLWESSVWSVRVKLCCSVVRCCAYNSQIFITGCCWNSQRNRRGWCELNWTNIS